MGQIIELPPHYGKRAKPGVKVLHPLPLHLLARGRQVPCRVYLKGLAEAGADPVRLGWSPGQVFDPGGQSGWEAAWGYFPLDEAGPILEFLKNRLPEFSPGPAAPWQQAAFLRDALLIWSAQFYLNPAARTPAELDTARLFLASFAGLLARESDLQPLVSNLRRYDSGLLTHVLNVCLLGLSCTCRLNWPEPAAVNFGLGTLLHDLGLNHLARATWSKSGPLTDEETAAIKAHPQLGAGLLKGLAGLPGEAVVMCAQHHENADGTGYPRGLTLGDLHPWSSLLKILDTFESLTSVRPWRAPLSALKALRCMTFAGREKSEYDAELLKRFARFWGQQ